MMPQAGGQFHVDRNSQGSAKAMHVKSRSNPKSASGSHMFSTGSVSAGRGAGKSSSGGHKRASGGRGRGGSKGRGSSGRGYGGRAAASSNNGSMMPPLSSPLRGQSTPTTMFSHALQIPPATPLREYHSLGGSARRNASSSSAAGGVSSHRQPSTSSEYALSGTANGNRLVLNSFHPKGYESNDWMLMSHFAVYMRYPDGEQHDIVNFSGLPDFENPNIENLNILLIWDKFPGLRELYAEGPSSVFFMVKFWVDLHYDTKRSNVNGRCVAMAAHHSCNRFWYVSLVSLVIYRPEVCVVHLVLCFRYIYSVNL